MKAEDLKRWPLLFKKFKKNIEKLKSGYGSYEEYTQDWTDLDGAFCWDESKQGASFWRALDLGDIETAKALQPKLFSIDNQVVEEAPIPPKANGFAEWFLTLPKMGRVFNRLSLDEIKVTMEELEYYYNTVKGIGCSIRACYHSDGSGNLVRCDCDGNNPIVLMSWGEDSMSKKDKLLLKLLLEKYGTDKDGFESGKEGSSVGSYGLPEEVWTEHGEFLSSLKCKWLPIMPSQLDTQEAETVACLLNIDRVRRVSYNTSNYCKVNYIVEGGDPSKIAETIYKYRCIGVQSVGILSCSFKNTLGETKQESFDYVY